MYRNQSVLVLSKEKGKTFVFGGVCLNKPAAAAERKSNNRGRDERRKEKERRKRNNNIPACPINKKNHTLPVTFKSNGIAYLGFCSKSFTAYQIAKSFLFGQEEIFLLFEFEFELVRWGCWDFWESRRTAALRMKGVVYWKKGKIKGGWDC